MGRNIFEVKLKNGLFPATSPEEAIEMLNVDRGIDMTADQVEVVNLVKEEHVMKMCILAKTMYDTDKFEYNEVEAAVCAIAREFGYYNTYADIANCVLTWVERLTDMTLSELVEWLTD